MTQEDPVSRNRRIEAEQVEAGRLVGAAKADPLHSQASEEAMKAKLVDSWFGAHLDACDEEGACCCQRESFAKDLDELVDRVSRERTRQALERAAKAVCWPCATDWPLDETKCWHGDQQCKAAGIWTLLSDGDSVASEEK